MAAGSQVTNSKCAFVIESYEIHGAIERLLRIGLPAGVVSFLSDDYFFHKRLARVYAFFRRRDFLNRYGSLNGGVGRQRQIKAGDIAAIDGNAARRRRHTAWIIEASASRHNQVFPIRHAIKGVAGLIAFPRQERRRNYGSGRRVSE